MQTGTEKTRNIWYVVEDLDDLVSCCSCTTMVELAVCWQPTAISSEPELGDWVSGSHGITRSAHVAYHSSQIRLWPQPQPQPQSQPHEMRDLSLYICSQEIVSSNIPSPSLQLFCSRPNNESFSSCLILFTIVK